jgi:predicted small lipoprotein YifL
VAITERPIVMRVALVGLLFGALALAGCGRKGPLEPPPSANAVVNPDTGQPEPGAAQPKSDRRFLLDGLI